MIWLITTDTKPKIYLADKAKVRRGVVWTRSREKALLFWGTDEAFRLARTTKRKGTIVVESKDFPQ